MLTCLPTSGFIKSLLPKFAAASPTVEITVSPRPSRHPVVIGHYINGKQTSRINYESIEFNRPLPDSLFAKPENAKAVK